MIIWGACTFICFIAWWWHHDDILVGFGGAVVGLLGGFLIAVIIGGFAYGSDTVQGNRIPLANIADGSTVRGNFTLFSGSIEGVPQYSWYEETAPNTFERFHADASVSKIHYTEEGEDPYYVETIKDYPDKFVQTWALNLDSGGDYVVGYDFYVPRGSITTDYVLDAEG